MIDAPASDPNSGFIGWLLHPVQTNPRPLVTPLPDNQAMPLRQTRVCALTASLATVFVLALTPDAAPQGRLASVKALRCTFAKSATGSWSKTGVATAAVKPSALVLRFDSIDFDDGTAQLRTGKVANEVVAKMAEGYVHFMQVFRTGPLYTTTVFDKDANGKLKAVHSRHEYFAVPLAGSTSSPEQYYGECEVVS